ncbi:MAG: serine/threonine-protein kinase [Planctomycetia bacterium]|nr:serine/threonine-protein kinase [Planctomycetia bacterium]
MAMSYLGSYRLLNPINTGQTTQLWQGRDDRANRYVAIKTLSDKQKNDKKAAAMLRHEYAVGKAMDHPNIIRMIEWGEDAGRPYLVMEWYPHGNMKNIVRQGLDAYGYRVPELAIAATEAVAYFNAQGWVHRDIKPDNFMVDDERNSLKLIDFAIAVRTQGLLARLFGSGNAVQGTRSYMSPEQIRAQAVDQRADLYSLACMLFELAVGRPPYTGATSNELLHKHLNAPIPSAETINANVTPEFSKLLRQAMAKKANERPATTTGFLTSLKMVKIFKRNPVHPSAVVKDSDN